MDMQLYIKLMNTLGQIRKHERWTRSQLEAYQAESLRRLREYAYARSPFYQRFHKGLFDRPLAELPVLTQAMVMENLDNLVTDRGIHLDEVQAHMARDREGTKFHNRYWVTATPGSTGNPCVFLFNRDEWAVVVATLGRVREWAGWETSLNHMFHRMPVALLASSSPWHMSAQMTETLNSLMGRFMPMQIFDVSRPLAEIVEQLNDWNPHMLSGPASTIHILAQEQLGGRLHLHPHYITLDSEVLETRQCIEDAWGHSLFNAYWDTLGGYLASERNDHKGLYLYEDNVILEVVDEKYRPVPPGVYGDKVLITMLSSRTQPLIRYELNDRMRLAAETHNSDLPFARIDGIQGPTS